MNPSLPEARDQAERPWMRLRKLSAAFRGAERGSFAVEFALILPMFIGLMLEIFQFGFYFYISSKIDIATTKAARQILIGTVANQNLSASQFLNQIFCPQLGGVSCARSTVVNLLDLPATAQPNGYASLIDSSGTNLVVPPMNNASTSFCPGFSGGRDPNTGQAKVEVLEVFYPMPVFSLYWLSLSTTVDGSSVYYVRSTTTFQNEPYPFAGQAGGC